jgi:FMN reductase
MAAATEHSLREHRLEVETQVIELRDHAHDLANHVLTGFPSPRLRSAIDAVVARDALIAVTPVYNASYSGLFKLFFDVLQRDGLAGKPVAIGATGGTIRHSLALEHAVRPMFAYLGAAVVPTSVYAATGEWGGQAGDAEPSLADRIERAARELAGMTASREPQVTVDPFDSPLPFEQLLGAVRGEEQDPPRAR